MNWFAEGAGALALVINFIGYRQTRINAYLILSALSLLCLSTHFFLLDAMAAGIGCMLASVRNFVALNYRGRPVVVFFVLANLAGFVYEWWVLDHGALIILAYSSALIFTVGSIVLTNTTRVRQWFVLAELLGLVYAVLVGSIFGSLFNISNLTSITIKLTQESRQARRQA